MKRLLVLSPFVCKDSTGEGDSAFQVVSRLARLYDVTLLTYRLRADPSAIEQLPGVRVVEWLDLPFAGRFPRLNSQLTPGYIPFYLQARRWLRANLPLQAFDLIHQLAPLALRYPCPATGLGVPYLIGPLAGSLETPPALRDSSLREPVYRKLRKLDRLRFRLDPLLRNTYSKARALIAVAPYVIELLASIRLPPVHYLSEAGVERTFERKARVPGPPRLLFVGRVIGTKGVHYAIRALALASDRHACLDIVGAGEELSLCRAAAASLGLTERVRFHGHLPRHEVDAFYQRADVFVFPSFREPSGKAILEAMSYGIPVIAVRHGGPATVVDSTCGVLVDPAPPEDFVHRIASAVDELLGDRQRLESLGLGARRRVTDQYTWDSKVDRLCRIYREVL